MSRDELLAQTRQLPIEERIDLIEQVEDEIGLDEIDHEPGAMPDWHREELEDRLNDPNEVATIPWDEVRNRLRTPPK